jgi:hypothetical protein
MFESKIHKLYWDEAYVTQTFHSDFIRESNEKKAALDRDLKEFISKVDIHLKDHPSLSAEGLISLMTNINEASKKKLDEMRAEKKKTAEHRFEQLNVFRHMHMKQPLISLGFSAAEDFNK